MADGDNGKKTMGLVCLLVNIIGPWLTGFFVVGLGGVIYGATQKEADPTAEKYFKNGLVQLIISAVSLVVMICCVVGLSWAVVGLFGLILYAVPLGMYIWSIIDAIDLYQHSQA